ncbi:cytidine and dCMP deaminase domain-containing protein 1 [Eucyclogobius newberryi]|uniref:cytidine and dCMP deaminase domain-containing protein 1 n=1 Tax=Eucyclogobius newberryi TaxID=166745 RepID=UPI003B5B469F
MEESGLSRARPDRARPDRAGTARDRGVQTDSRGQGQAPRLSKGNLFTLLSLWMELFPQEQTEDNHQDNRGAQTNAVGLVVVKDSKVIGLHSSGSELHSGQAAVLEHGAKLSQSSLYFSRRPCATCLKMIINAGVSQICFWPGDPEVSMLRAQPSEDNFSPDTLVLWISEEAALDSLASDKLKSNSRAHICVPIKPLTPGIAQFVHETSRDADFMEKIAEDVPEVDVEELYNRDRLRALASLSSRFLVESSVQHQQILSHMNLENFCVDPYFCGLRHNMQQLVQVLSAVVAGVPKYKNYGFYRSNSDASGPPLSPSGPESDPVSAEVAVHCMVQARLLSYRTEDPKVGVGAVIWAKRQEPHRGPAPMDGLYLVGCGFNAYPSGSHFNEFPQMDDKQEDRQRRKYRYIVHAEQNALTFRTHEIRQCDPSLLFVTKCPCDECVPLIRAAGVSYIYSSDLDQGRDKGDISYKRFKHLQNIHKFCWQRSPAPDPHSSSHYANGFLGKHNRQMEPELQNTKKLCTHPTSN